MYTLLIILGRNNHVKDYQIVSAVCQFAKEARANYNINSECQMTKMKFIHLM